MPNKIILPLLLFWGLGFNPLIAQHAIEGKWKDSKGGGIIQIYEQDGLFYGQLVEALDEKENEKIKNKEIPVHVFDGLFLAIPPSIQFFFSTLYHHTSSEEFIYIIYVLQQEKNKQLHLKEGNFFCVAMTYEHNN